MGIGKGRGKRYLPTLAETLAAVVESATGNAPQATDLAAYPILVFDQNAEAVYRQNTNYLQDLAVKTGAKFVQISMSHVLKIAATLKIADLFDASGSRNAGYGGCRNIN